MTDNKIAKFQVEINGRDRGTVYDAVFRHIDEEDNTPWASAAMSIIFQVTHDEVGMLIVNQIVEGPGASDLTLEFKRAAVRALAQMYELHTESQVEFSDAVLSKHDIEIAHWDDELLAHSQANFEFSVRSFGLLNANLVPFDEKWRDEFGGMANAIFDLPKRIREGSTARLQGRWTAGDGRIGAWNYCPMNDCLIYHMQNKGVWEVNPDKIQVIDSRGSDAATIYRPFMDGENVKWLKTRELVVQSNHHLKETPLYVQQAIKNAQTALRRQMTNFPMARFFNLLLPVKIDKYAKMQPDMAKVYRTLMDQACMLSEKDLSKFRPFHIHSYMALYHAIREFNVLITELETTPNTVEQLSAFMLATLQQESIDAREHPGMSYMYFFFYKNESQVMLQAIQRPDLIPAIPDDYKKLFEDHEGYYNAQYGESK